MGCREGFPTLGWIAFALSLLENKICRRLQDTGTVAALPGVCYRRKKPHIEVGSHSVQEVLQPSPLPEDAAQRLGWGMESVLSAEPLVLKLNLPQDTFLVGQKWFITTRPALGTEDVTMTTTGRLQWRCQMWRGHVRSSPWKTSWGIHPC